VKCLWRMTSRLTARSQGRKRRLTRSGIHDDSPARRPVAKEIGLGGPDDDELWLRQS